MCFYYDDQQKMAQTGDVKCRKDHRCEGCSRKIRKGEKAEHNTGLFDGSWYSYYVCDRCQRLILSIAATELLDGCQWHTAWCSPFDLAEYVSEKELCGDPIEPLRLRTIEDCRRYVNGIAERFGTHAWQSDRMILLESF